MIGQTRAILSSPAKIGWLYQSVGAEVRKAFAEIMPERGRPVV